MSRRYGSGEAHFIWGWKILVTVGGYLHVYLTDVNYDSIIQPKEADTDTKETVLEDSSDSRTGHKINSNQTSSNSINQHSIYGIGHQKMTERKHTKDNWPTDHPKKDN